MPNGIAGGDPSIEIVAAHTCGQLVEVRSLFEAYAASLGFSLCFQGFNEELATLPGDYAPPRGAILLAHEGKVTVGCAALRPLSATVGEMKRLYVPPKFRGRGLGKALTLAVLEEARRIGYATIRLDTLSTMKEALGIYFALGFKAIPSYRPNPMCGAVYLELPIIAAPIGSGSQEKSIRGTQSKEK